MRGPCHKAKGNRVVDANTKLLRYKKEVREKLNNELGLKYNHGFKRFLLRGLEKTEIEAGLISLAHNLRKMAN